MLSAVPKQVVHSFVPGRQDTVRALPKDGASKTKTKVKLEVRVTKTKTNVRPKDEDKVSIIYFLGILTNSYKL
jgi:hypothetical protein